MIFLLLNLFFAYDFLSLTAGDTDDNFACVPPDFNVKKVADFSLSPT